MKNLKQKILSLVLCTVLVLSVLPMTVFAEGNAVAKIGDYEYETLADAISAANNGDTVKLIADIDLGVTSQNGIPVGTKKASVVIDGKSITLDINGKTLKADGSSDHYMFYVASGSSLTVTGSGTLDYSATSGDGILFQNYGTVTIDSGASDLFVKIGWKYGAGTGTIRFRSGKYNKSISTTFYDNNDYAVVGTTPYVIYALPEICTVDGTAYKSIASAASAAQTSGKPIVLICDASCSGISSDVTFAESTYTLTSTGTISKGTYNLGVSAGYITGGTFNSTVTSSSTVAGGTFNSSVSAKNITGGTFRASAKINDNSLGSISGGVFNNDPEGTVKDGYEKIFNEVNGKYFVTKTQYVSEGKVIGGTYAKYLSVADFADTSSHTVLTANASYDYVVRTSDLDNDGKLYKGAYDFSMTGVFKDGYSYTYVTDGSLYVIGENITVDGYITGGVFDFDVTEYVNTEIYDVTEDGGVYTVKIKDGAVVATVGDAGYPSLTKAFSTATEGQTVKLQKDIIENFEYWNYTGKTLTFDLNGHKLSSASGTTVRIIGNGTKLFTIKDSVGNGSIESEATALLIGSYNTSYYGKPNVKIESGIFKGVTAIDVTGKNGSYKSTVTVTGGYFNGNVVKGTNAALSLQGGSFSVNPLSQNPIFPEGYSVIDDEFGTYRYRVAEVTYDITAGVCEHGSVLVNGKTADEVKPGVEVTLTNNPDADYKFSHYLVNGDEIQGDSFTVTEEAVVTAVFAAKVYVVQNTTTGTKYESITEAASAAENGETIKLIRSCSFDESQYISNWGWGYIGELENVTLDLNNRTLYLTGSAQLLVSGKNILIKRGEIRSEHDYAIKTSVYGPMENHAECTTLTVTKVTLNAGINMSQTTLTVKDCNFDASGKAHYVFWLDNYQDSPNTLVIESGKYKAREAKTEIAVGDENQQVTVTGGIFAHEVNEDFIASGYDLMENTDTQTKTEYPNKIGIYLFQNTDTGVKYVSLGEALGTAEDGETVALLCDITLCGLQDADLSGKTVTLDLNGKTWKLNSLTEAHQFAIRLAGSGTLIIDDSTDTKLGKMIYDADNGTCKMIAANSGSTANVTVKAGTVSGKNGYTAIECGGNFTIIGGSVSAVETKGNFTMTAGKVGYLSMFSASGKSATVSGGEITNQFTLPYTGNGVTVTVSAGKVENITNQSEGGIDNAVTVTGGEIGWLQGGGTTTVSGGLIHNVNGGNITITGGKFENLYFTNNNEESGLHYRTAEYSISGGAFTSDKYVTDKTERLINLDVSSGLYLANLGDGTWTVKESDTVAVESNPEGNKNVTVNSEMGETKRLSEVISAVTTGTNVSGVELTKPKKATDLGTGLQNVIEKAKIKSAEVKNAIEAETNKIINVKVDVSVNVLSLGYLASLTENTVTFEVKPKATVTVVTNEGGEETTVSADDIDVTNDMLDKTKSIKVDLHTGFKPTQVIHKDDEGKIIGVYLEEDFTYDETTGITTLYVHHFSFFTALNGENNESATEIVAEISGGDQYSSLSAALAAADSGDTVILLSNISDEKFIEVNAGVTLDLNGHSIIGAKYVYVTGKIEDTSATRGVISSDNYFFAQSQISTPIYNEARDGYSFYNLEFSALYTEYANNTIKFTLKSNVNSRAAFAQLLENATEMRLKALVTLSWTDEFGTKIEQNYFYNDTFMYTVLNSVFTDNAKRFTATVSGVSGNDVTICAKYLSLDANGQVLKTISSAINYVSAD